MKNEKLSKIRFGVEIEVEFPHEKDSYELIEKNRLIRGWEVDWDGSLSNGAEYRPKNKNKLYYTQDCIDQIKEIIGLIKAHKGHIKPSCGCHVHIDMSKFTKQEIINIVNAFYKHQDRIYSTFKVLKSRRNHSAKKLPKKFVASLTQARIGDLLKGRNDLFYDDKISHWDRDYGINICSLSVHKTIEFRLFNGTIRSRQIQKYIEWCIEFCLKHAKK